MVTPILSLYEVRTLGELLPIQEIDHVFVERLLVKAVVDGTQTGKRHVLGCLHEAIASLLVQRRIIGHPQHGRPRVRIESVLVVTIEECLDHGSRHNGLT